MEDGLAIAFATVHHLLSVNCCRTMFATHFHELADMLGYNPSSHKGLGAFSKVAFFCTDVDEIEVSDVLAEHRKTDSDKHPRMGTSPTHTTSNPGSIGTVMASRSHRWLACRITRSTLHDLPSLG